MRAFARIARIVSALVAGFVFAALVGCATFAGGPPKATKAVAVLRPLPGGTIQGTITFIQEGKGVRVIADVSGLTPGKHGFHIHEFGDLAAADGSSVGGHFNPYNSVHGGPDEKERHLGDLGNLEADKSGIAKYNRLDSWISMQGRNSIIGRSVVIKEKPDDFKTQPGGGAGGRIAFGVIGVASLPGE